MVIASLRPTGNSACKARAISALHGSELPSSGEISRNNAVLRNFAAGIQFTAAATGESAGRLVA